MPFKDFFDQTRKALGVLSFDEFTLTQHQRIFLTDTLHVRVARL